jgi:hypothetical protein
VLVRKLKLRERFAAMPERHRPGPKISKRWSNTLFNAQVLLRHGDDWMSYVVLTVGALVAVAAICALPWLCECLFRSLIHSWRSSSGGGAFNPLQEMVQPQVRHVVEVKQHRQNEDDGGSPPYPDS